MNTLNLTEQEHYIQQLEARIKALYSAGNQAIVMLDTQHRILDFNPIAAETSRARFYRDMARGDCFTHYVQPDRLDDFYASFEAALKGQHVFKERLIFAADQQGFTYEMSYTPIYDAQGEIESICFVGVNVEDRRQIQLRLNQEQSFVSSVLNATNALIVVLDTQGRIVRFNKACEQITGHRAQDVQHKVLWEALIPASESERVKQIYTQLGKPLNNVPVEYTLQDTQGRSHPISWSLSLMQGLRDQPVYIVSTGIDLTERLATEQALKESEAMLRQAQKMEAVGHLAGGIAHDFNNLLTAVIGYSQLLQSEMKLVSDGHMYLQEIQRVCRKAHDLTQQLLLFSRKAPLEAQTLDLGHVLIQMSGLLRQLVGEGVDLQVDSPTDIYRVKANPSHLEQVIMNLVVNARDAVFGQGYIKLWLAQHTLEQTLYDPNFGSFPSGEYICLALQDDGCGILPEVRKQLFDPFFTTKDQGTGLGLAIVYRIMQESKGWVEVQSSPETGQTGSLFKLFFPRFQPVAAHSAHAQRLLLYAMKPESLNLLTQSLTDSAYVTETLTELTQLETLAVEAGPQLLITTLDETILAQTETTLLDCPSLKILYLTGDSSSEMMLLEGLGPREDALLSPFTANQLRHRIKAMLTPSA